MRPNEFVDIIALIIRKSITPYLGVNFRLAHQGNISTYKY